jgi:hypothetical protein
MKQERISNCDAHYYAAKRKLFKGSNLYSEVRTSGAGTELYVVYSYGEHFPMFIAETTEVGQTAWYENESGYSVTTSKHKTQARPRNVQLTHMEHDAMRQIALKGLVGHIMSGAQYA